jgi:membrane protein DedA with SNARE-associated domain
MTQTKAAHRERVPGAFHGGVRAFVPLLAGMMSMSSRHFYLANVLSALVWAPMHESRPGEP